MDLVMSPTATPTKDDNSLADDPFNLAEFDLKYMEPMDLVMHPTATPTTTITTAIGSDSVVAVTGPPYAGKFGKTLQDRKQRVFTLALAIESQAILKFVCSRPIQFAFTSLMMLSTVNSSAPTITHFEASSNQPGPSGSRQKAQDTVRSGDGDLTSKEPRSRLQRFVKWLRKNLICGAS